MTPEFPTCVPASRRAAARLFAALLLISASAAASSAFQSHESIRHTAESYLSAQAGELAGDTAVKVSRLDPRLHVPRCSKPLTAFLPPGSRPANATTVGVQCAGEMPWTLYVPAHVTAYARVVVATRPLARGHRIEQSDIALRRRDTASLPMGYLTEPGQVLGQQVRRPLTAGAALEPAALSRPQVIRRGEQVTIIARSGALEVRMLGQALMDGSRGQQIRVRNLASKEIVSGTVSARGTVDVQL